MSGFLCCPLERGIDLLSASLDIEALVRDMAERSAGFTPAYLKEVFVSAALQRAQDGAMILDEQFAQAAPAEMNTSLDAIGLRH